MLFICIPIIGICGMGIIVLTICNQFMDACCQSWWQSTVPISKQGQVFAIRRFVIWIVGCGGTCFAGFSDYVVKFFPSYLKEIAYEIYLLGSIVIVFLITIFVLKNLKIQEIYKGKEKHG